MIDIAILKLDLNSSFFRALLIYVLTYFFSSVLRIFLHTRYFLSLISGIFLYKYSFALAIVVIDINSCA